MAPVPATTNIVFIRYTSMGIKHRMQVRLGNPANAVTAVAWVESIMEVLITRMLLTDSILGADFQAQGTTFTTPMGVDPMQGTITNNGDNRWADDPESVFLSLAGRSVDSKDKVNWKFFTPVRTPDWPAKNRYYPGQAAVIDTFRINLTAALENAGIIGPAVADNGSRVRIYNYMNIAHHAYWQRQQRA